MDAPQYFKFFISFAVVLCLMFLLSWVLKKTGLATASRMPGAKRRLKVIEQIGIDSRHRLVLVQRDGVEHLLLLGHEHNTVIEKNIPAALPIASGVNESDMNEQETAA